MRGIISVRSRCRTMRKSSAARHHDADQDGKCDAVDRDQAGLPAGFAFPPALQQADGVCAEEGKEEQFGEVFQKDDGEVYIVVYGTERRICELVWEAWDGEIPEGFRVSHIDGDKQNNRLDNLELVKQ